MEIKNILVATDFSNEAYAALFYATQLLATEPCTFHIINIYDDLRSSSNSRTIRFIGDKELRDLHINSLESLTKITHRIKRDTDNLLHSFNTISSKGAIPSVIVQTIDELHIDLLVMGNKGKTGAKELFMGSNTISVANTAVQCPILAIPKEKEYTPQHEIAFVTDYKKGCSRSTIDPLLTLAEISKAAIRVIHINEENTMSPKQEANKKLLELCLKERVHSFHNLHGFTDKAKVIQGFLSKRKITMLAMTYRKRNFLERLIYEPVIRDMSIYTKIPFLILPVKD